MKRLGTVFSVLSLFFTAVGAGFFSYLLIRSGLLAEKEIVMTGDGAFVLRHGKFGFASVSAIVTSILLLIAVTAAAVLLLRKKSVWMTVALAGAILIGAILSGSFTELTEYMFVRFVIGVSRRVIPLRLFCPIAAIITGVAAVLIGWTERKTAETEK